MNESDEPGTTAWYRQPLVWMVIGIPASSVIVGIVLLGVSIHTYDGLVADDYYRRGLEINRELSRDQEAVARQLRGEITIDAATHRVVATLVTDAAGASGTVPESLTLRFIHPTRAGTDRVITLRHTGAGSYLGQASTLLPGHWHLALETDSWRLVGRLPIPGTGWAELSPRR